MQPNDYKDKCDGTRGPEQCWIHWASVTGQWASLFPQKLYEEPITLHYRVWDLYVKWPDGRRGRVNGVRLCHKHSARLWQQWGIEGAEELATSETFDEWSIKNEANRWLMPSRSSTQSPR